MSFFDRAIAMFIMPFILQSPLAMLGLLTLLIPLLIHLLSKARPRVVAFAHIAFIKVKTSPVLRQLRLTQLILLGIRMLMLLLATLILAQLYWLNIWDNANQQVNSHILLTEDWLNHTTDTEKQTLIDQVRDSDLVLLSTQNRDINKTEVTQWSPDSRQTPALNIWNKVADYSAQLPADALITVYTTNRLKQFIGSKTPIHKRVKWQVKAIPVESATQQYSANIKVIYDDASEPLLVYLRAAFEVINTHETFNLKVDYVISEKQKNNSKHLLTYDKTINLSEQGLSQQHLAFDTQWQHPYITHITQTQLKNIKQADFVFTLARLLYSSQSQIWWLENTRLSAEQIKQSSAMYGDQLPQAAYKESSDKTTHTTPLHIWLVLVLAGIFVFERLLSEWPKSLIKTEVDQ
jgi:hypothetical protein